MLGAKAGAKRGRKNKRNGKNGNGNANGSGNGNGNGKATVLSRQARSMLGKRLTTGPIQVDTVDGLKWALANLNPCGEGMNEAVAYPDDNGMPTHCTRMQRTITVSPPGASCTGNNNAPSLDMCSWNLMVITTPWPEYPWLVIATKGNDEPPSLADYLADPTNVIRNGDRKDAPGVTSWGEYTLFSYPNFMDAQVFGEKLKDANDLRKKYQRIRVVAKGTTTYLNASRLYDGGRVICGQYPVAARYIDTFNPKSVSIDVEQITDLIMKRLCVEGSGSFNPEEIRRITRHVHGVDVVDDTKVQVESTFAGNIETKAQASAVSTHNLGVTSIATPNVQATVKASDAKFALDHTHHVTDEIPASQFSQSHSHVVDGRVPLQTTQVQAVYAEHTHSANVNARVDPMVTHVSAQDKGEMLDHFHFYYDEWDPDNPGLLPYPTSQMQSLKETNLPVQSKAGGDVMAKQTLETGPASYKNQKTVYSEFTTSSGDAIYVTPDPYRLSVQSDTPVYAVPDDIPVQVQAEVPVKSTVTGGVKTTVDVAVKAPVTGDVSNVVSKTGGITATMGYPIYPTSVKQADPTCSALSKRGDVLTPVKLIKDPTVIDHPDWFVSAPPHNESQLFYGDAKATTWAARLGTYQVMRCANMELDDLNSGSATFYDLNKWQDDNVNPLTYNSTFTIHTQGTGTWAVAYYRNINMATSVTLKGVQFTQGVVNPAGPFANLTPHNTDPDPAAIALVTEENRRLAHAYPASYNDLGQILGKIFQVAKSVGRAVSAAAGQLGDVPVIGDIAKGIAGVLGGLGL